MIDFARAPARCQAIRLPIFWAVVRRICYTLAQKGDPTIERSTTF